MSEIRPYKILGLRLKNLREKSKENLLEVSGAVEIDKDVLADIEAGFKLPEEDVLMLLINHFNVSDAESLKLWELAGFDKNLDKDALTEEQLLKQVMLIMPIDNKIAFSDNAKIEANKNGVVINFLVGNMPQTVARIGMSVEATRQLIASLACQIETINRPKTIKQIPANNLKATKGKKRNDNLV